MSKERRVDPQVLVGLLVTPGGFPLEIHEFPGNTGETLTLLPVLRAFQDRHGVDEVVVVADAGMLSASNLNQIEDAGFSFIVGSRISKPPTTSPSTSTGTVTSSTTGTPWKRHGSWGSGTTRGNGGWSTTTPRNETGVTTTP